MADDRTVPETVAGEGCLPTASSAHPAAHHVGQHGAASAPDESPHGAPGSPAIGPWFDSVPASTLRCPVTAGRSDSGSPRRAASREPRAASQPDHSRPVCRPSLRESEVPVGHARCLPGFVGRQHPHRSRRGIDVGKSLSRAAGIVAVTAALALLFPAAATAAGSGAGFGHHVRDCTQSMGFERGHNPGMHHGFAGWDPGHLC